MLTVIILISVLQVVSAYKSYDNYKVIQVIPQTRAQIETLHWLQHDHDTFKTISFWRQTGSTNAPAAIMVDQMELSPLLQFLAQRDTPASVVVDSVQRLIDEERASTRSSLFRAGDDPNAFSIDQYHSIQEINDWMQTLANAYPDFVSIFHIGNSFENRPMTGIKIGSPGTNKPGFFIDAGIHAREWIAVSTAVYIINQLVTEYSSSSIYKEMVDNIDFYIIPSLNPDGYTFTRNQTHGDRLWRKTRTGPHGQSKCMGVDPNRNFDYYWKEGDTNPCSDTYAGPQVYSEIECSNLAQFLQWNKDTIKAYLTLHTFGADIIHPYSHLADHYPDNVEELKAVANQAASAIQAIHGTRFSVGTAVETVGYGTTGASDDWVKYNVGTKLVYTFELRPSGGGFGGFILPATEIIPAGEETWAGIQVMVKHIMNN